MSERREPVMSGMRPERDDAPRQQQRSGGGRSRPPNSRPSPPPVVVKSRIAPVAFLLALIGICVSAYAFWQLDLTQRQLADSSARLSELEGRMALSDDESTQSVSVLQARLKESEFEVRKLWDTRNVNKKAIEGNKAAVDKALSDVKSTTAKVSSLGAEFRLVNELVDAQQGAMNAIDKKAAEQITQLRALSERTVELEAVRTELLRRMQDNDQAIEAIDAFRVQVNRELLQLRSQ